MLVYDGLLWIHR